MLHIITGLETGGAETMLLKLVRHTEARLLTSLVISLRDEGSTIGAALCRAGVPVQCLKLGRSAHSIRSLAMLPSMVRAAAPDIVQGWMYHGNIAALLAARAARLAAPVIWNVRQTSYELANERRFTRALIRLGAPLSRHPRAIIYNSRLSASQHRAYGYAADRERIVPNGFDVDHFHPVLGARAALLRELGLSQPALLVGLVARFHPMKNHVGFLEAAALVRRSNPSVHFVLVGRDVDAGNEVLSAAIQRLDLAGAVHLLGPRTDLPLVNSALDVACSYSSWGDAFPNVIGEAMACGTPCIVTDVGDAADIVGDTGIVVPPRSASEMAAACLRLAAVAPGERHALGLRARDRIVERYTISAVAQRYAAVYAEALRA